MLVKKFEANLITGLTPMYPSRISGFIYCVRVFSLTTFKSLISTYACNAGNMVLPNKESPDYLTTIGLWDIRRDLDNRIKHEDPRYTSALAIMAAKSSYENEAYIKETVEKHWKMEFLEFFNCWNGTYFQTC
ncbi:hypothetical protein Hanom_Chr09g00862421 [Helianthus anomalus]